MNAESAVWQANEIIKKDGLGLTQGQIDALESALGSILTGSIDRLQSDIGRWQVETFGSPDGVILATHQKLQEEQRELMLALSSSGYEASPEVMEEWADNMIVLLGLAARLKFSAYAAIVDKMAVNRKRSWPRSPEGAAAPVKHLEQSDLVVPAKLLGSDPT
jgi:hypothetical protein